MSLKYSYTRSRVRRPLVSLGGRFERPRPVIPVTVIGPSDTRLVTGLLDTGADDTIVLEALATRIGVDLTGAPAGTGSGYGMQSTAVRYAEVTLRIADSNERRQWQAWVGFTAASLRQPLLGYAGFLQFFDATFRGELEEVELAINGS